VSTEIAAGDPMIKLRAAPILARGTTRLVYAHPFLSGCLIKVIRPDRIDAQGRSRIPGTGRRPWPSIPLDRRYADFAVEVYEYLMVRSRLDEPVPCIQSVIGLAETDLGLGLVVEKLCDPDGGLAPTVASLVMAHGFTDELMALWKVYFDTMLRLNVVSQDWNLGNLVCATDQNQRRRIVLIDGLGDRSLLRLRSRWPWLNRVSLHRKGQRALRQMKHPANWVLNRRLRAS
jgi:hypothetical protein